ncbi:aldolase catalytic domain-containing protein [bacterium]|nr:aldolase catalytic domain-containing protein [Gemmiger sp.]MCI5555541.1 aldolase catalytic domain-containing protein [bacterium]MDY5784354.1 aldolase catalytic domain-containing protein [Gemmiger sp.]
MPNVKLLDCTLRDGGYINDWRWGYSTARDLVDTLTRAGTDIVEVGFLRNVESYRPDVTVCNTIEELNRLLPDHTGHTMYSGMAMRSNYDIAKLSPYDGTGIEMIRITAHDYDIREGMDFAREVKARGYKLSINPINIMGYSDQDLLWILDQVNRIMPYQFSIVDTFGSMRRRDLQRIVSLVDHNLAPEIRVGLHLHENMALSFCLAQEFLDLHLNRDTTVDASLMGMGRIPGNLPIELVADYMNETLGTHYDIDELMDAIQDHIAPIKGEPAWGYTPAYFLSARYNLHRNYAEHYLGKGDLTNRDINHILAGIDRSKATVFDRDYADQLYREYQNRAIDDAAALDTLRGAFGGKTVLVLAPGASLGTGEGRAAVAGAGADCVVSANFCPEFCVPDYAFFTNSKRYEKIDAAALPCPIILTSNLRPAPGNALAVGYDRLSGPDAQDSVLGGNSVLMLLRLLRLCGAARVLLAGADGYRPDAPAYADDRLHPHTRRGAAYNAAMAGAIRACGLEVTFLTPSEYDR